MSKFPQILAKNAFSHFFGTVEIPFDPSGDGPCSISCNESFNFPLSMKFAKHLIDHHHIDLNTNKMKKDKTWTKAMKELQQKKTKGINWTKNEHKWIWAIDKNVMSCCLTNEYLGLTCNCPKCNPVSID